MGLAEAEDRKEEEEDSLSEEFSEGEDDEELDQDLIGSTDDSGGMKILTDAELDFLTDSAPDTATPQLPSAPTRACRGARTDDKTRTTFICLNEDAFRDQIAKEQKKSSESLPKMPASGPTRAQRTGQSVRTTFICLNESSFNEQLQKEAVAVEKQSVARPVPSRPPRPSRPDRPPRPQKAKGPPRGGGGQNLNFPRFGAAPPARKANVSVVTPPPVSRKMPPAFRELIQTEKDYIAKLELIQRLYLTEIREKQILSTYETVSLFSNIEDLIPVNKSLLEDLLQLESDSTKSVGEVFQQHAQNFQIYGVYCSNQPNIHELLNEFKQNNKEFTCLLKKCFRVPECKKQDLESFLVMPLQRLCRYPLLLKELVSFEHHSMAKTGPATSGEHGICVWGEGISGVKRVEIAQHWVGIACGGVHCAAVSLGNSVYVWGKGREGQLGLGENELERDIPTLVPLYSSTNQPLKVMKVTCGPLQTAIITDNRELYLWGALNGQRIFVPTLQLFDGKPRSVRSVSFGVSCIFALLESESVCI